MDHHLEALRPADFRRPVKVGHERLEAIGGQPGLGMLGDATGEGVAHGLVDPVAQHGEGPRTLRGALADEAQAAPQPRSILVGLLVATEALGQESAHELQATRGEPRADLFGIAQEAGRAQLRAFVADLDHPVEHLLGPGHPGVVGDDLVYAEADGGAGDGQGRRVHGRPPFPGR